MFASDTPFAPHTWDLDEPPPTLSTTAPSGVFGAELDFATGHPATLADAELVDAAIGFERLASWAAARQATVVAEFTRRPGDGSIRPPCAAVPAREWVDDEIAMALTVSRGSAQVRIAEAVRLDGVLRPHPRSRGGGAAGLVTGAADL